MKPQINSLEKRTSSVKDSFVKLLFFGVVTLMFLLSTVFAQEENITASPENEQSVIAFDLLEPKEFSCNYFEELEFSLRVKIYSKNPLQNSSLEHNFTKVKEQSPLNCTIQTESNQDGMISYECSYLFPKLTSGEYAFKVLAYDVEDFYNSTQELFFSVKKPEPNISLLINSIDGDAQCEEGSVVNIDGFVLQNEGLIELFFNGSKLGNGSNTTPIHLDHQIIPCGIYNLSLAYNETENYQVKNITRIINVTPFEFNIIAKQEYPIGAKDSFLLYAPKNSTLSILNFGPKESMIGSFAECLDTIQLSNEEFPKEIPIHCVNKTGEYFINATLTKNNITKRISTSYKIKNSIDISLNGRTSYFKGEEVKLSASATGGILPYNYSWLLENGTRIAGNKLNLKYDTSGNYEIRLEVNDKEGNLLQKLFTISINDWYQVQVKVLDPENKSIALAGVSFDDEKEYTNDSGLVSFKLVPNEYEIMVSASGYRPKIMDYEVKKNESLTIRLERSEQVESNLSSENKISLIDPYNSQLLSKAVVYFKATVDVSKKADCVLYVAEKDSSWFEQIADFDLDSRQNITFNKEFEDGEYKWKVECAYENSLPFSSEIHSFVVQKGAESNETSLISYLSSTDDEELVDAGLIRTRIDEAYTNLESLDYEEQGPANALNFRNNLDLALRDFERILRDINALQFRRDLSDAEKDKKRNEYQDSLELLEKDTFYDVIVTESKEFVTYPKKEDLESIAKEYAESKSLLGSLDYKALNDLQNKILVKTTISHVELVYLDQRSEEITLIDKEVTLTGNVSQKSFLMEYIPKNVAQSTDEITTITKGDILKKDPILKFPAQSEKLVYYIKGIKELDAVKDTQSILMSDEVFLAKSGIGGNLITGAFIFSMPELSSSAWLVVVLLFILVVYLIYAFDLFDYVKGLFGSNKKKEHQMNLLINDCRDYLEAGNLSQANLVFKEIKLHYEKYPKELKAKVYKEAISVFNEINKKFFEKILEELASNNGHFTKESLEQKKCLLIDSYNALDMNSKEKYRANYEYLVNLINKVV